MCCGTSDFQAMPAGRAARVPQPGDIVIVHRVSMRVLALDTPEASGGNQISTGA
jgi:hypothetical protein